MSEHPPHEPDTDAPGTPADQGTLAGRGTSADRGTPAGRGTPADRGIPAGQGTSAGQGTPTDQGTPADRGQAAGAPASRSPAVGGPASGGPVSGGSGESPAAPPADALDRAVQEVRALLESTVVEHRARRARNAPVAEVEGEDEAIMAAAEQLAEQARCAVDLVLPATTPWMAVAHAGLCTLAGSLDTAVTVRVLRSRQSPDPGPRCQVRLAEMPLPTLLIADGRTALVCAESAQGRLTSVIQDTAVVGALHGLFGGVWAGSRPVARSLDFGSRARTEMVRRVLERLRDGVTDEAAARELAISVRTYRRYVTGILELLGAGSRFQAGVRATELGILGDRRGGP